MFGNDTSDGSPDQITDFVKYVVDGLAVIGTCKINGIPAVVIVLDPEYQGELRHYRNAKETDNQDFYQAIDENHAKGNSRLLKFMEVLHHWDNDRDDVFDAQANIASEAIENTLTKSIETPLPFVRPKGPYTSLLMRFMPPQPARHVIMGFGKLEERNRWFDYFWAVPVLIAFIALSRLQVEYLPFMQYSVITGYTGFMSWLKVPDWFTLALLAAFVFFAIQVAKRRSQASPFAMHSPHTVGFFSRAATYEEQIYREGSERWTFGQRLYSCFAFGAWHMINLIYPLSFILPLSLAGGLLMWFYLRAYKQTQFRRSAVLHAAVKHRLYNRVAIIAFFVQLAFFAGQGAWGLLTFALPIFVGIAVVDLIKLRDLDSVIKRIIRTNNKESVSTY